MSTHRLQIVFGVLMLGLADGHAAPTPAPDHRSASAVQTAKPASPADVVTGTSGCVAFWDFVEREPGERGLHVTRGAVNERRADRLRRDPISSSG